MDFVSQFLGALVPFIAELYSELSVAQLVRFLVVEPAHQGLSSRLGTGARSSFR